MLPTLFLSHGSPMQAAGPTPVNQMWAQLAQRWAKPKAILMVSAHWESEWPLVGSATQPETIHDFGGFPAALYQLQYPASGSPALAEQVQTLLHDAGIQCLPQGCRGLDHGAWVPLRYLYPEADVPVVQLSVQPTLPAAHHLRMGQALRSLRDEGVLIIGSGHTTHNLGRAFRAYQTGDETVPAYAENFRTWLKQTIEQQQIQQLLDWESAPDARVAHPSTEHFLPLFVVVGAALRAGLDSQQQLDIETLFTGWELPGLALDSYLFN